MINLRNTCTKLFGRVDRFWLHDQFSYPHQQLMTAYGAPLPRPYRFLAAPLCLNATRTDLPNLRHENFFLMVVIFRPEFALWNRQWPSGSKNWSVRTKTISFTGTAKDVVKKRLGDESFLVECTRMSWKVFKMNELITNRIHAVCSNQSWQ